MEKVAGEQYLLAIEWHFPQKSFKFSENLNCGINLLFNVRGFKLVNFAILDLLFLFMAF